MGKIARFGLLGFSLSLLLGCGQTSVPTDADPYAGGKTYPWELTDTADFSALSLTSGPNTLQFETPTYARNAWGPIERNRSNGEQQAGDGKPLTLDRKVYAQGYGVHAGSELRFNLAGSGGAKCFNFTADVGIDAEVGSRGSVVFQVFADGVKLYDSGVMKGSSATKRVNVGVVGKKELKLIVTDAGDGISYDHADWADPRLECGTANPKSGSLDTSWEPIIIPGDYNHDVNQAVLTPDNTVLTGKDFQRQADGKRLMITNLEVTPGQFNTPYKFSISRLFPDGTADTSYGKGGKVLGPVGFTATSSALQPDGKLLVAGVFNDVTLARYNANGSLDTSFGQGGMVSTDLSSPLGDVYSLEPQPSNDKAVGVIANSDGTIVVIATYNINALTRESNALIRYKSDGSLDKSFDGVGFVVAGTGFGGPYTPPGFLIEPNGDIVYNNQPGSPLYSGVRVDRISQSGEARQSSGNFFLGTPSTYRFNGLYDQARQVNGKIVLGGYSDEGADGYGGVLARLNQDLTLDTSFGNSGTGQLVLSELSYVERVLIQPDGKIVAVGYELDELNNRTYKVLRFWP